MMRNGSVFRDVEACQDEVTEEISLLPLRQHHSSHQDCPHSSTDSDPFLSSHSLRSDSTYLSYPRCSFSEEPCPGPSRIIGECTQTDLDEENGSKCLWKAVKEQDLDAVQGLLASYAPLACHLPLCSLLHWCLENYEYTLDEPNTPSDQMKIVFEILEASSPEVIDRFEHTTDDNIGSSLLSRVIYRGYFKLIQILLEKGASIMKTTKSGESALHMATKHPYILKQFLNDYDIPNGVDDKGYAAIHWAATFDEPESIKLLLEKFGDEQLTWCIGKGVKRTVWHLIVQHNSNKVAQFLLDSEYRKGINVKDEEGETPFYFSACCGYKTLTVSLLRMGSFLSERCNGKTVVEQIVKNVNEPVKLLEETFDQYIFQEPTYDRVISVNFYFLSDYEDSSVSQIDVIKEMVRCGLSKLLVHPLIESLLYLRWKILLPVFYTMLVIYAVFLIAFNIYLVKIFTQRNVTSAYCSSSNGTWGECYVSWVCFALIYIGIVLLLMQECMYIWLRKLQYFLHVESWLKLAVLTLGATTPLLVHSDAVPRLWQRHLACLALMLAWLQAMLMLSRFPRWGYYVLMFERVAFNVFKVCGTAVCLVIAFAICFMIQYQTKPPFDGLVPALVKTLVMMSSEFDYGELFEDDRKELEGSRTLVRLLFVVFVIFVAIVLMNFMIGVAVNDVNELNLIGNIRRLEKQVELLGNLEVIGNTMLGKYVKPLTRVRYYHMMTNNLEHNKKWEVVYMDHNLDDDNADQYAQKLPLYIKEALMNVVNKKKLAEEETEIEQKKQNKLNALYDAVVGTPHTPDSKDVAHKIVSKGNPLKDELSNIKKAHEELNHKFDQLSMFVKDICATLAARTQPRLVLPGGARRRAKRPRNREWQTRTARIFYRQKRINS